MKIKFLTKIGVLDKPDKINLTFSHTILNQKPHPGFNHHSSHHTMALQRSKYICLEDNTNKKFIMDE